METTNAKASRLLRGFLATPWLRPLNDAVAIDDLVGLVRPTFSLTKIRARVVAARRETASARTLVLEPNHRWPGHAAGQHVNVEVEIAGRRVERTFSLSSPPRADGRIEITVKRSERAASPVGPRETIHVSAWWNDDARIGDVLTLSAPAGEFVLPDALPPRITMLSAGSGITPVMAMLRGLASTGTCSTEVTFVHVARSRAEAIFVEELETLAARHAWLKLSLHFTSTSGRPGEHDLSRLARESADAPVFVCGPAAFMESARRAWRETGFEESLRMEHFGLALAANVESKGAHVTATRTGSTFEAWPNQSLLEAAEAAGLSPKHGCRMGVCHTCICRRTSGTTVDLRDGRVSSEPGQMIQLCVSAPRTAVTLDL
jgi:stearoyl-CoA 9-desaturase NADPH oxidoreductase